MIRGGPHSDKTGRDTASKRLQDDELFREIGGQLDASKFDYSQWQRNPKAGKGSQRPRVLPSLGGNGREVISQLDRPFTEQTRAPTVASGAATWASGCKHGAHHAFTKRKNPRDEIVEKRKAEHVKVLQLRIKGRRKTIEEYRKRHYELKEDNMRLQEAIEKDEKEAHEEVKKLLRKYERFGGGISSLSDQFLQELSETKKDVSSCKLKTTRDLQVLQGEVDKVDKKLKERLEELHVLVNYKDKEYPVKSLMISELQKEMEHLKLENEEEEGDLQHIVDSEIDKFRKTDLHAKATVMQQATEQAITAMHPSLSDMALQNKVMEKEIEFHENEVLKLQEANKELKAEVERCLRDPKSNIRLQMFPEFFPSREKCTPDMEVILDIPTQEWLPI